MKLRALVLLLGAAALTAVPMFADEPETPPDVTVVFNGPFSPDTWGGDYAGLYNATIDGVLQHVICDDYFDNINSGDTWKADVIWASTLNNSNITQTMFGGAIGLAGYAEVATIVQMMFNNGTNSFGATMGDLSGIIWYITSQSDPSRAIAFSQLSGNAQALYNYVFALVAGQSDLVKYMQQFGNLKIFVPDNPDPSAHLGDQEFWGVPEGGSALLFLLLAGGACFVAMRIRPRNRIEMA